MKASWSLAVATVALLEAVQCVCTAAESTRDLVKEVSQGVVKVIVSDEMGNSVATGTGFFLDDSTIVTCYHALTLVAGVKSARIVTPQRKTHNVKGVVASDRALDILLLTLDHPASDVRPLVLAKLPPQRGDQIIVLGYAEARGKLNVLRTRVTYVTDVYRTGSLIAVPDLIPPGHSGSPAVNSDGEVTCVAASSYVSNEGFAPGVPLGFLVSTEAIRAMKREAAVPLSSLQTDGIEAAVEKEQAAILDYTRSRQRETTPPRFEVAAKYAGESIYALRVYARVGMAYFAHERYTEALEVSKEVTRLMPNDGASQALLGACYMSLGRSKEAVDALEHAIRMMPDCAAGYVLLGTAYVLAGDRESAVREYKKTAEIDKDAARHLKDLIDNLDSKTPTTGKGPAWACIVLELVNEANNDKMASIADTQLKMGWVEPSSMDGMILKPFGVTATLGDLVRRYGSPDKVETRNSTDQNGIEETREYHRYGPVALETKKGDDNILTLVAPVDWWKSEAKGIRSRAKAEMKQQTP